MCPVIILENLEGVLGKALQVPNEQPFFVLKMARPRNPFSFLTDPMDEPASGIEVVELKFEALDECVLVGNVLARVYRQMDLT